MAASAETVRRRTGALPGRVHAVDKDTRTVDCSGDDVPGIARHLAALGADYTLDADPDVLEYLRLASQRSLHAISGPHASIERHGT